MLKNRYQMEQVYSIFVGFCIYSDVLNRLLFSLKNITHEEHRIFVLTKLNIQYAFSTHTLLHIVSYCVWL